MGRLPGRPGKDSGIAGAQRLRRDIETAREICAMRQAVWQEIAQEESSRQAEAQRMQEAFAEVSADLEEEAAQITRMITLYSS